MDGLNQRSALRLRCNSAFRNVPRMLASIICYSNVMGRIRLVSDCRQTLHLAYLWDGTRITSVQSRSLVKDLMPPMRK